MTKFIQAIIRAIGDLVAFLPRSVSLALGTMLGTVIYYVMPVRKRVAITNIRKAFPDLDSRQQKRILRRCYKHFGIVILDILFLPSWAKRADKITVVDSTVLDNAVRDRQGLVLSTGHLGNWEMIILALGRRGYPFVPVVKVQKGIGEAFAKSNREASGCDTVTRGESVRTMLRLLKEGKFLGLAGDQEALGKGTWVNFFGQPSSRFKGAATFHLSSGAPIYFMRCLLNDDGKYHLEFVPISTDDLSGEKETDIRLITQRIMDALEVEVRRQPEQYFWFHRLWKSKRRA